MAHANTGMAHATTDINTAAVVTVGPEGDCFDHTVQLNGEDTGCMLVLGDNLTYSIFYPCGAYIGIAKDVDAAADVLAKNWDDVARQCAAINEMDDEADLWDECPEW